MQCFELLHFTVTQADLYADEVNDDISINELIRSFKPEQNYTIEYSKRIN